MGTFTLRAVQQPDGRYHIAIRPAAPGVDVQRAYSDKEVRQLAKAIDADVRWVTAPEKTRQLPGGVEKDFLSDDLWGDTLSASGED
jgi:hypothetical protein